MRQRPLDGRAVVFRGRKNLGAIAVATTVTINPMPASSLVQISSFVGAMLILIASVFFSGFLVSLDTIVWPVRIVSYALPATYAIRTLDDVMLRGILHTPWDLAALAGFAVVFFAASVALFHREFRAR